MNSSTPHGIRGARLSPAAAAGVLAVLFGGAIFGFFYAWVCSTVWGLDAADPRVAIAAMQAMNDSVRNAVFFPAFFLTPVVMSAAGWLARREHRHLSAILMLAAAAVYLVGGLLLTMLVNVPMNEDLAAVTASPTLSDAERIWNDYSGRWQMFNQIRTVASGLSLLLVAVGLAVLGPKTQVRPRERADG
jgi:uncharacterized membrane protein